MTEVSVRESRLRWPVPVDLASRVVGKRLLSVGRRGKYLLLGFIDGVLIVHLGMSGTFRFHAQPPAPGRHDHIDLHTDAGVLRYNDPRRFGAMLWHPLAMGSVHQHALLGGLGVEPFSDDFDAQHLYRGSRGRQVSAKQFLLAGHCVVGVGNIYACESLFRAGIHPSLRVGRLSLARCERLAHSVRLTLAEAISRGGSTLRDFVGSGGESGYFQLDCRVYGRAGQPCRECGTSIRLLRQQGRSSFFCPQCQRR
jgi:formamidopyrimidine-DNA glycosylase